MQLAVQIDTKLFEREMGRIAKEIPFAIAYSLTLTGRDCVVELRNTLRSYFTIRTGFIAKGLRSQMIRRGADPTVQVGSSAWFMALQESGGVRIPPGATSPASWVPVGARKNKGTRLDPGRFPGKLDDPGSGGHGYTGDVFTGEVKTKKGRRVGTWRRVVRTTTLGSSTAKRASKIGDVLNPGKWRGEDLRRGVQLLYWNVPEVTYKPRWPFGRIVEQVVADKWPKNAIAAIKDTFEHPNAKAKRAPMRYP